MSLITVPETTTVDLFQGDDRRRIKELEAAIDAAAPVDKRRIADKNAMLEAAKEYDAFVTEAGARAIKVTVTQVDKTTWRELREAAGPPRPGWTQDERQGFNGDNMADMLVPKAIVEITKGGEQEPTSGPEFDAWFARLPINDLSRLYSAAVVLNTGVEDAPKAEMYLLVSQTLDAISTSPDRLG